MKDQLKQWIFYIDNLLPDKVKLKEQIWLKEDELLLEKSDETLYVFLADVDSFEHEKKIKTYLYFTVLFTHRIPILKGGNTGFRIESGDKLGTAEFPKLNSITSSSKWSNYPDELIKQVEESAVNFIEFIRDFHNQFIDIVNENDFLEISLEYFYGFQFKYLYKSIGLIDAMISLEALLNEGGSAIRYKVSLRSAFLLGLLGEDSSIAFEEMKTFYSQRSNIVHGDGNIPYIENGSLLTKYLKELIKIFLILLENDERRQGSRKKRKKRLLSEIDNAMLNLDERERLRKEINEGLELFEMPCPKLFEVKKGGSMYKLHFWE
jgi:hypothetical protein